MPKYTARNLAKKGLKKVKTRYTRKGGSLKTNKIMREAMMAYKMLNAEKKFIDQQILTTFSVGQVRNNLSGAVQYDVTPLPLQNNTASGRNGNSIKLTSSIFQFQISGMSGTTAKTSMIIELWHVKGTPLSAFSPTTLTSGPIPELFDDSIFSTVVDSNSPRDQDHFADYALIRRVKVAIAPDQATGDIPTKTFNMPIKWNNGKGHHIRYDSVTGAVADIANGDIVITFRADVGNAGGTLSTLGVPITAQATGLTVAMGYKHWYYDN